MKLVDEDVMWHFYHSLRLLDYVTRDDVGPEDVARLLDKLASVEKVEWKAKCFRDEAAKLRGGDNASS